MTDNTGDTIDVTFRQAEQVGLKLAIKGRLVAVVLIALWLILSRSGDRAWEFVIAAALFGALGVLHYALIGSRFDRPWLKYVFITLDILFLTLAIAYSPYTTEIGLSKMLVFQFDLFFYFFVIVAVAAFSFSPGLVLWTGMIGSAAWLALFAWARSTMTETVDWTDIGPDATAEEFLGIFLSPNFIGTGSRIQEALTLVTVAGLLAVVMRRARRTVRLQLEADAEKRSISDIFGQYVPRAVADIVIADRGSLAPIERVATVLFVDIANFTALTERIGPARTVSVLNAYFDAVTQIISEHNGVVTQFQGDAVLATFNVPLEDESHANQAVNSAVCLLQCVAESDFAGERLGVRIGVNTGSLIAGNVGGGGRQNYTVHGDAVNMAARLEAMNKELNTKLLISQSTAEMTTGQDLENAGSVTLRGLSGETPVFTLSTKETET